MQFLFPNFLWALFALSIPILIHLFYFRRFKKVYFTNVKFLKEIKEETSNRNKLKNLLVLLCRCLALVALVFAFCQPYIPTGTNIKSGQNLISIFIDNSFSMTSGKNDIPLLDIAKDKSRQIINSYGEEDRFQILTHDFEGKHQRLLSRDDALAIVDDITPTPTVQNIDLVLNRQNQILEANIGNKISYVISDFQKSITNLQSYTDTLMEINLVPVQTIRQKNISIDSVWFDGPVPLLGQPNKLVVKVKNNSPEPAEQIKISFKKDGQEKPVAIRDISANSFVIDTVNVSLSVAGWHQAIVQVLDYPVQFDDTYFIAFKVPDTIKALFINDNINDKFMSALFNGVPNFNLTNQNASQLQYQQFSSFDIIMLHDLKNISSGLASELSQYIQAGGKVLLFPGKEADLGSYNSFISSTGGNILKDKNDTRREVGTINTAQFIFSDVYVNNNRNLKLPVTTLSYNFVRSASSNEDVLLTYRDGGSYISKFVSGDGQLFVCSSPLSNDVNDLVFNAEVFVPMIYKMAISTIRQKPLSYTINQKLAIQTENVRNKGDYVYKISNGNNEIIPSQVATGNTITLHLNDQVKEAGFYDLLLDKVGAGEFALNFNRKESDMNTYTEIELEGLNPTNEKIKVISTVLQANIGTTITEKDKGIVLWKWCLLLTLLFLALETFFIRFFKN